MTALRSISDATAVPAAVGRAVLIIAQDGRKVDSPVSQLERVVSDRRVAGGDGPAQDERLPQALHESGVLRCASHQIFGDDPRCGAFSGGQVRATQGILRCGSLAVEAGVDRDFDELHQGQEVSLVSRDELLEDRGGCQAVTAGQGLVGPELRQRPLQGGQRFDEARHRVAIELPRSLPAAQEVAHVLDPSRLQPHLELQPLQLWIVDASERAELLLGARRVTEGGQQPGAEHAETSRLRRRLEALVHRSECLDQVASLLVRCRHGRPVLRRPRKLACRIAIASPEHDAEQTLPERLISRRERQGFAKDVDGFVGAFGGVKIAGDALQFGDRQVGVTGGRRRASGPATGVEVGGIEAADLQRRGRGALRVAARLSRLHEVRQVGPSLDADACLDRDRREAVERVLVQRLDLQNALVERLGARQEPLIDEVVGLAIEERGRPRRLVRAQAQVRRRGHGLPVVRRLGEHALVLRQRLVETTELDQFLRLPERLVSIECHGSACIGPTAVTRWYQTESAA